jgi:cystathionine beta-lyase/cystathionine gamma-synthase
MACTVLPPRSNSPAKICELEKGYRTIVTPGGQGAIALINLALLKSGDHILIPESVYTPNRKLAYHVLRRFGVEASFYPPEIGGGIKDLLRQNTRLVWCESPGSITMEVQDVPAIAEASVRTECWWRWITPGPQECISTHSRTVSISRCKRLRNMWAVIATCCWVR